MVISSEKNDITSSQMSGNIKTTTVSYYIRKSEKRDKHLDFLASKWTGRKIVDNKVSLTTSQVI